VFFSTVLDVSLTHFITGEFFYTTGFLVFDKIFPNFLKRQSAGQNKTRRDLEQGDYHKAPLVQTGMRYRKPVRIYNPIID